MSIVDVGRAAAESSSGTGGSQSLDPEDYERYDLSGVSWTKMHPGPTAVGGTAVALRILPPDPNRDDDDRADVALILEDPFLVDDDEQLSSVTAFQSTQDSGDDIKVVNTDDEETTHLEGTGVMFGKNTFLGEPVDEDDLPSTLALKLTGNWGRSAVQCLDVNARGSADVERTPDGAVKLNNAGYPEHNGKLVEYIDTDDENTYEPPKYSPDPELRDDLAGREVAVLVQRMANVVDDHDGDGYWATVFGAPSADRLDELAERYAARDDDDRSDPEAFTSEINGQQMLEVAPTADFERDPLTMRATAYLDSENEGGHWPSEETIVERRAEMGIDVDDDIGT